MGSYARPPDWSKSTEDGDNPSATPTDFDADEDSTANLGDVLSGRLADVDVDSVEAVRETRERR